MKSISKNLIDVSTQNGHFEIDRNSRQIITALMPKKAGNIIKIEIIGTAEDCGYYIYSKYPIMFNNLTIDSLTISEYTSEKCDE